MARWQTSNILQVGKEGRLLWHFSTLGEKVNLTRTESRLPGEPLPAKLTGKDWQTLFQPKLNIAWLPPEHVFLRAIQLPKSDLAETQSMVELQLEKLSPMPVAQIVWAFEVLPHPLGDMQTAIVVIAARNLVEEFLGRLETQGYLADRLELPLLDQLRATPTREDGVWVYPGIGNEKNYCLLAWWCGGVLQHVSLIPLPPAEQCAALLKEQLAQTAWAGELEGWLTAPPRVHVVTDNPSAEPWLQQFVTGEAAEVVPSAPAAELATHTIRRLARNGASTNLLPPEYTARYRQQFIDRLWMRGLGAVLAVYLMGVAVYFGWVQFAQWRLDQVAEQAALLANSYTNTLQIKAHVNVLQDQIDLQYAALDCWKAVADYLPPEMTLQTLTFDRKKLSLSGSVADDSRSKVGDFNEALRSVEVKGQSLFTKVNPPNMTQPPGSQQVRWNFTCDLKRTDNE